MLLNSSNFLKNIILQAAQQEILLGSTNYSKNERFLPYLFIHDDE